MGQWCRSTLPAVQPSLTESGERGPALGEAIPKPSHCPPGDARRLARWIVAGVKSGLRITFFAAEPELPGTRLSLWQSVDEDAPIAGDIEMSRSYEDRGKMA